jgi:uncharacterized membrane protein
LSRSSETPVPGLSKGRIESLTDGIFATVMTVLVLSLSAPVITGSLTGAQLSSEVDAGIQSLLPDIVGYVLSFLILAVMWVSHHSVFAYLRGMNRALVWLNIVFLLTIGFVPFSTALLGRYPTVQVPVMIYGANMLAISIAMQAFLWYAISRKLVMTEGNGEKAMHYIISRWRLGSFIYGGAMVMSFVSPVVSVVVYGGALVFYVLSSSIGLNLHPVRS